MAATSTSQDCAVEVENNPIDEQVVEISRHEDEVVIETKVLEGDDQPAMDEDEDEEEVQPVLIMVKDSSRASTSEGHVDSDAGGDRAEPVKVSQAEGESRSQKSTPKGDVVKRKRGRPKKSKEGLEAEKPRKKSRKSGDAGEIRRSTRERHVKVYEDFLDEDDDENDDGDGLTAAQRAHLDRRLKAIGTTKTWRKQIRFICGETAKQKKSYVRRLQAAPVLEIIQDASRPSQAIIKRFVQLPKLKTSPAENCKFLFRPQDTFGVDMADKGGCDYTCDKCQFTSSRINNMIRHQTNDCVFNKDFFSWNEDCLFEATSKKKKTTKAKNELGLDEDVKSEVNKAKEKSPQPGPSTVVEAAATRTFEPQLSSEDEESDEEGETLGQRLGIKRHDIVWVKHGQNVYWPGLVLKILNRGLRGKARSNTIQMRVFLIHNGTKLTVQSNKVENFDSPKRKEFLEGGQKQKAALATEHARAAQKADKFLRERVLGVNIDPVRFFCLGETKLIQEHESSSSDDDEVPDEHVEGPRWELATTEDLAAPDAKTNASRLAWVKRSKDSRRVSNQALVEFITEGKVEAHLVGIYRGTVPSQRHDHYTSEDDELRQKLKQSSWWGPIDDQLQQEAIYEYCHELVERSKEVEEVKGLDTIKYAFEVFCPEAITKAICKLAMVDMETAAEIFEKGAQIVKACGEESKQALEQPDAGVVEPERENVEPEEENVEPKEAIVEAAAEEQVVEQVDEGNVELEVEEEMVVAEENEPMEEDAEQDPEIPLPDVELKPSENLNTGEVVREELARLGVDSDLLREIEQA